MADTVRTSTNSLNFEKALRERPYHFDFFQALRRLECAHREKPRVGHAKRAADDPVRLGQEPSLAFAPSSLASYSSGKPGFPSRLSVFFFGLFGPNGPLPLHLTEYARDRRRNEGDPTFSRFADIFHHRMLTLFYRAWANAQPTVNFDRPDSDRFALYVGSLLGIGMPSLSERDAMPDKAKYYYAGQMICKSRNAEGLENIIKNFFNNPVTIKQFIGEWLELPGKYRFRLGTSPENSLLGQTTTLGSRVWDCQQKFRIKIGPMNFEDYRRLLPGKDSLKRLIAIVRQYIGFELDWDLLLTLKKEDVPQFRLGKTGNLGWTTWIGPRPANCGDRTILLNPLQIEN